MEFQYQSPSAQPYHQFMPIQSLSPPHSGAEDFSTSPPNPYKTLPQYHNFDYSQSYLSNPTLPTSPPTPPGGQNTFSPQAQHYSGNYGVGNTMNPYVGDSGTSEENDPLTPAQSRRKAQNRAAQQAFRKRKERHVKDLEAKLADLEAAQQQVSFENEALKQSLHKVSTENRILRATSQAGGMHKPSISTEPATGGPRFNPSDFYSNILQDEKNGTPSHRVTTHDGERLLSAGATWDLIINHKLFKKGIVDVGDVTERLKQYAYCDGQGPVFSESSVIKAIEQSVLSKTDDLL
ncbi:hypothetical protein G7Z17_g5511 [Cylindrodendrum hubeiense]|uniref:BZIP domain-containing protein n=1 Tax=Cylindrodendrum hubeiense TaxID=595255 RepID=A0A9P5H6J6_9HYPO|nr:hypothetical protein G7Z17_g5511 [Cylindrodendrum hubeiense]